MPPNLDGQLSDDEISFKEEYPLILASIDDPAFQEELPIEVLHQDENEMIFLPEEFHVIPLEQNLKELLIRVTNTEDLSTVTQVKLRVISREVTLQYLSIYTPALRELILDGSVISSLRDLGDGLKNLKILKVNRCALTTIDGVFGFEDLEELYAADNTITSIAPCAFLTNIRLIDLRNNYLIGNEVTYFGLCLKLEELHLAGNADICDTPDYRRNIARAVPSLKILDGESLRTDLLNGSNVTVSNNCNDNKTNLVSCNEHRMLRDYDYVFFSEVDLEEDLPSLA